MKRAATTSLILAFALLASLGLPAESGAALRSPQVAVSGSTLQTYLNSVGQTVNVLTDQDAAQSWLHTVSGTTEFTINFQGSANAALQTFGIYSSSAVVPSLVPLVSCALGVPSYSIVSFQPGNLIVVNRFDNLGSYLGSTTFPGVDPNAFSFYLDTGAGTYYSQDARNPGGAAQALAFAGTGSDAGSWWLCWEESQVSGGSNPDYADEVILMSSVNPTPVSRTTWGQLKARFH
jgi:hypothetical protein